MKTQLNSISIPETSKWKLVFVFALTLLMPTFVAAQELIIVQKSDKIQVESAQKIRVYNMKGVDVNIKGTSTKEVKYKVFIKADESSMMRNFGGGRVYSEVKDGVLEIYFKVASDSDKDNSSTNRSWIKSFFTSSITTNNSVKEARLDLEIPESFDVKVNARYSNLQIESVQANVDLMNRSGDVSAKNIGKALTINNDYGNVNVENITGTTKITSRSGDAQISRIAGSLDIESNYSNIRIDDVKGSVTTSNKSGTVKVDGVGQDFTHRGDYSTVKVKRVKGLVSISNVSGTMEIEDAGGLQLKGNYSTITAENIHSDRLVAIEGKSGTVKLKKVAGAVSIDGAYMKLDLKDLDDNLKVYNKSGSVDVEGLKGNVRIDGEYNAIDISNFTGKYFEVDNRSGSIRADIGAQIEKIQIRNRYGNVDLNWKNPSIGKGAITATHGNIKTSFDKEIISKEFKTDSEYSLEFKGNGKTDVEIRVENGNVVIN